MFPHWLHLQRWAVLLTGYDFDITFKNSADDANTDDEDLDQNEYYLFATVKDELPVTAAEIAEGTKADSLLVKVYKYIPLAGQALAQVQSSDHFGIVEMSFHWERVFIVGQACHLDSKTPAIFG